jgi:integrase
MASRQGAQGRSGILVDAAGRPTVAQWLDHWHTHIAPLTTKRTTQDSYAFVIDRYLKPEIGRHKLTDLTPAHVREMLRRLERDTESHRPLSPNSRRIALAVLRRSLKFAVIDGLVARNVAALEDGVKLKQKRGRSLTPEQARQVIAAIADCDEMTEALLTLLIVTGMRKGEALGLRWSDIDAKDQTAHVCRTLSRTPSQTGSGTQYLAESTKTAGSDRVVELEGPAMSALKRWRTAQRTQRLACPPFPDGLDWGLGFPDDLVFTGPRGQALDLSRPNELLATVTENLGLGRWTPHELRHTAASLMLGANVPLPTVSRVLGHSNIGVTMNTYGHLVSGEKKDANKALTGVLFADRPVAAGSDS